MSIFRFKDFEVDDHDCGMKVCSDSVLFAAWVARIVNDNSIIIPSQAHILDIGAGSGVISLILARECQDVNISAIEIDSKAAEACRRNFENSPWAQKLELIEGDVADYIPAQAFDVIVSNPPYFVNGAVAESSRGLARHQGTLSYHTLCRFAKEYLKPSGSLFLISPADLEGDILFTAELDGLKLRRLCKLRTSLKKSPTRIMWEFTKSESSEEIAELSIRTSAGEYSEEYRQLVENLYSHLPK